MSIVSRGLNPLVAALKRIAASLGFRRRASAVQYNWAPPAQTVHDGAASLVVPSGLIHQTAYAAGGGAPNIQGVYCAPTAGWESMV